MGAHRGSGGPISGPAPHSDHFHISTLEKYDELVSPWSIGGDMSNGPNGEPNWDKVSDWAKNVVD